MTLTTWLILMSPLTMAPTSRDTGPLPRREWMAVLGRDVAGLSELVSKGPALTINVA
jgi:hypothetical protein